MFDEQAGLKPFVPPEEERVNILIVDDRTDKLMALSSVLEDLNQNIVTATSGRDALRMLLKQDFAVILLDVNMPLMDGFETASLIRQRPRSETTPIIFISAINDTETHVSRGYSLGAVDYMLTPVVPEILRTKVAVFVDLFKKTEMVKRQADQRAEFIRAQAARFEAEAAQERMTFLATAGSIIAGTLDRLEIYQRLARLPIPRLADCCAVDIVDEHGTLQPVEIAHKHSEAEKDLRKIRKHAVDSVPRASAMALESCRACIRTVGDEAFYEDLSCSKAHMEWLKMKGISAAIIMPLICRGRVLGVLKFLRGDDEYTTADLSLTEAFAERASLALENAWLYEEAQNARREAERANKAKDQFLAMLSHELRTPLMPVLTSVLAMETDDTLNDEIRPSLEMIRRNVELEARLIDDLLDLTRISKEKIQLNLEVVDAHAILRNALEICSSEITQKGLAVNTKFEAKHSLVEADSARLQQIFWNLIKNSVKFTPKGGVLTISTESTDKNEIEVRVSDTGIGIDLELLPKIFDAFEQGERMRYGGLGLGLAITKAMVELHRGKIRATSEGINCGSQFTVVLPTTSQPVHSKPEKAPELRPENRKHLRILLVEDHEDTNRSLTLLLKRRGYEVRSAKAVEPALELAATQSFDVLVSDMGLPDGSGLDVIQGLPEGHNIFSIALSGFGMEADIKKSQDAGFQHHLIKPVDVNLLDEIIQRASGE